ncbi:MAG TPA: aldehyde dehydrogenase family protein [Candidatus Binatia bacterium]|jgi:acyl-CoA reductase-like NAD-dependent aldehyde dehydrogenase|nr:aldehyde dehydrogenase family protein [Candidatus Binatia bacterium]
MEAYSMVINGRSVATPEQDDVINPARGEPFATCPRGSAAHVDEAVLAAAAAYKSWRRDEAFRREKLRECASAIQGRAQEIAQVLSLEQGKPVAAAMGEVFGASMWFSYYAGLELSPEILSDDGEKRIEVVRKPLGVVAAITPWNFPVILLAWKLAPAWLAGNTVVAKPSPYTPLTSLMVAETLRDIVPAGVLNVLSGGNELGALLSKHPLVRKISFTGSVNTGKKIAAVAAEDLKRVTLELGGNDPAIVLDDVDPKAVAEGLFWGAFQNSGQVCTAIKRLYVHEKVYQPIVDGLVERARKVKVGDGMDPDTQLGPINNKMQLERVMGLVEDAKKNGGTVRAGGVRLEGSGYFYPPTIVTDVGEGVRLVDEEQFGTALPIIKYSKLEDAIEQANRTHYGLGGSVWSSDTERGKEVVQELESGTGWVNHHMDITPFAPFGGSKWSGIGYENGRWGYEAFTELQVVNVKK